jgi:hypothetical protein
LSLFLTLKGDSKKITVTLTPLRAITIAVAIVGRAITIWEAIQKRSRERIYKTHTKIEAKRLRATFAIAKMEER